MNLMSPALRPAWGAVRLAPRRWRFSIWAPQADRVAVEIDGRTKPLRRGADGFFSAEMRAAAGESYVFVVDGRRLPDPASRALAGGVHGRSVLVDPGAWTWRTDWAGRPWEEAVLYELHIGSFTRAGTFVAAARELPRLAELGFTAIQLMPVAQFPGRLNWGYDAVQPYAPHEAYGGPEGMRDFVDAAHRLGMMVILDVIYNHFGPEGCYLPDLVPGFFVPGRSTDWGDAIDYRPPQIRRYFIDNALYLLDAYRLDGLRLDAIDHIWDPSEPHLLDELAAAIRAVDFGRPIHLTTEDARNITRLHSPETGRYTAEWNDDYHHAVHVLLTGESQDYYGTFAVDPFGDLVTALADGFVEQGQRRPPETERRGEPSAHLPWPAFVNFNQNHDQVGNRPGGERLLALADPAAVKVAHALLLSAPFTPLVFMGEERGVSAPFLFFADHSDAEAATARLERSRTVQPDPQVAREWEDLTRHLLRFRREAVWPLVKSGRAGDPQLTRTAERALRAEWPFGAGRLVVEASFGTPSPQGSGARPAVALGEVGRDGFAFAAWTQPVTP